MTPADQVGEPVPKLLRPRAARVEALDRTRTPRRVVEYRRPYRAGPREPVRAGESDGRQEDAEETEGELALQARDDREHDVDRDDREADDPRPFGVVVDAERRQASEEQQPEQRPHHADLDRVASFGR